MTVVGAFAKKIIVFSDFNFKAISVPLKQS